MSVFLRRRARYSDPPPDLPPPVEESLTGLPPGAGMDIPDPDAPVDPDEHDFLDEDAYIAAFADAIKPPPKD